jgi:hypothetical protein
MNSANIARRGENTNLQLKTLRAPAVFAELLESSGASSCRTRTKYLKLFEFYSH